jgi:hypothetical protein
VARSCHCSHRIAGAPYVRQVLDKTVGGGPSSTTKGIQEGGVVGGGDRSTTQTGHSSRIDVEGQRHVSING